MLIPPGLHFDPLAAAKEVDSAVVKKYAMPYKGQTFVQLHQGGTHVVLGTVVGFDIHMDRQGNLLEWRASIECKFTSSFSFSNGSTWRDASEWHPAPEAQQETVGDLREKVRQLEDAYSRIVLEVATRASLADLEARLAVLEKQPSTILPVVKTVEAEPSEATTTVAAKQPLPRFRKPPTDDLPVK